MRPRERARPVPMSRVALVATQEALRDVLVAVAAAGCVQLDVPREPGEGPAAEVLHRLEQRATGPAPQPCLAAAGADLPGWEPQGRGDLLAGEAELELRAAAAVRRHGAAVVVGWMPTEEEAGLAERIAASGAALVELPPPRWVQPPTQLRTGGVSEPFQPLVDTYATVPYRDVDPTLFAAASLTLMFGMMFADAGHGLLLALGGLWLRRTRGRRFAGVRRMWPVAVAAGLSASVFGVLYGELFGPTHILPVLWLAPLEQPVTLLLAGACVGALLLAVSYGIGAVNRWREGGPWMALTAPSGIGGLLLFIGAAGVLVGAVAGHDPLRLLGSIAVGTGVVLVLAGLFTRGGSGGARIAEASVEFVDTVLHVGANAVSFTRLAAFGLMHAAIGWVVWQATAGLWHGGPVEAMGAVLVFCVGNALAFVLEALVAGVQALRLEYYELFSRIFAAEGWRFCPWQLPVITTPVAVAAGALTED